jgi:hypothetical protein
MSLARSAALAPGTARISVFAGVSRCGAIERDGRRCVGTEGLNHAIEQRVGACCVNEGERIAL